MENPNVESSREEWKSFLRNIQLGRGNILDEVWQYVSEAEEVQLALITPPTYDEFQSALKHI